jgi:hypothetical protein
MFGTPKRLIVSSTIAVAPADFETSARNANALPPSDLIRVAVSSAESPLIISAGRHETKNGKRRRERLPADKGKMLDPASRTGLFAYPRPIGVVHLGNIG